MTESLLDAMARSSRERALAARAREPLGALRRRAADQPAAPALRLSAEYELLLTQKLILQPRVEINLYGKSDPVRDIGSGLSDALAGLRLRYQFTRQFALYAGIEWTGKFGETADFSRAAGKRTGETRRVAGVRFWF